MKIRNLVSTLALALALTCGHWHCGKPPARACGPALMHGRSLVSLPASSDD